MIRSTRSLPNGNEEKSGDIRRRHMPLTHRSMATEWKGENWSRCESATICTHLLSMVQKWMTFYFVVAHHNGIKESPVFRVWAAQQTKLTRRSVEYSSKGPQAKSLPWFTNVLSSHLGRRCIWCASLLCGIFVAAMEIVPKCNKRFFFRNGCERWKLIIVFISKFQHGFGVYARTRSTLMPISFGRAHVIRNVKMAKNSSK